MTRVLDVTDVHLSTTIAVDSSKIMAFLLANQQIELMAGLSFSSKFERIENENTKRLFEGSRVQGT